ncbi:MAG: AAA family ATPase [Clostridia bacterium]|nr:AAA family ATPase [Clostridia bacterium]
MGKKLPIGIQEFEKLRTDGFLYVDKTEYVYQLVHENVPYYLSRPGRFGKSLLLSTLKAYWEGKRELFEGLAIERLEKDHPEAWKSYPVFCFDFHGVNDRNGNALEDSLHTQLRRWEAQYHCESAGVHFGERFQNLLIASRKLTGLRSVILVDDYDKPLMDAVNQPDLYKHNKEVFQGFFSTLKSFDEYIQFVFITGVSKIHHASIFSGLNQLRDISMTRQYAEICGMTEKEIDEYLADQVTAVADELHMTVQECRCALRKQYGGYHFHPDSEGVYNPYSFMGALLNKDFGSYWLKTGTPAFVAEIVRKAQFDVRIFMDQTMFAGESVLKNYTDDFLDPVSLLYQTGYLTITDYDHRRRRYTLGFPNEEVRRGFLESLSHTSR